MAPPTAWFKSSYSDSNGGACVEVAALVSAVGVTDSKVTDGPAFVVHHGAWATFVASMEPNA
ncbi:DUF397 domain-containing protein [Streptomyces sp. NBC_01077]|uniref:DUF397 domain-containing protein n=1 Tax=Streptomyces sp. NBC_01077 TaxID=2903746 RepID=UPI003868AC69|nr:DUF397 domain-containing protein [Streptomyces sp. NBC_01077]WSV43522.1 DUF397 domain-containing protein [Streptomyces sp. NBC_01077]